MTGQGHIVDKKPTIIVPDFIFSVTVHLRGEFLMGHTSQWVHQATPLSLTLRKVIRRPVSKLSVDKDKLESAVILEVGAK